MQEGSGSSSHPILAFIALWLCLLLPLSGVEAASSGPIPDNDYPHGSHVYYYPDLSNARVDCEWGFFCEGDVPLYHLHRQDALRRVDGWTELASWHQKHRTLMFALYVSHYQSGTSPDGSTWSESAFHDVQDASAYTHFIPVDDASAVPAVGEDRSFAAIRRSNSTNTFLLACWRGTTEVEGIAIYDRKAKTDRATAQRDLEMQIQIALQLSSH